MGFVHVLLDHVVFSLVNDQLSWPSLPMWFLLFLVYLLLNRSTIRIIVVSVFVHCLIVKILFTL